jgi:hypothetical protein
VRRSFDIKKRKIFNLFETNKSEISMDWSTVIIIVLLLAAGFNFVMESLYFIRVGICYVLAKFFKRKVHILEKCAISGELKVSDE